MRSNFEFQDRYAKEFSKELDSVLKKDLYSRIVRRASGLVQSSYIIIVLDFFEFKELGPKEYVSGEFKK